MTQIKLINIPITGFAAQFIVFFAFIFLGSFFSASISAQTQPSTCNNLSGTKKQQCLNIEKKCSERILRGTPEFELCVKAGGSAATDCIDAVKRNLCEASVANCDKDATCIRKALEKNATQKVYSVCRDKPNPQNCHRRVVLACKDITGEELKTCRSTAADSSGTGSAGGAVSLEATERQATADQCGEGENAVKTEFNFGCTGKGNPIIDLVFAFVRFLSIGVGLVLAAAIIYAGILYSASSGNPEATSAAKQRIQNAVIALVFYLFIFAIIQYLVPGGLFNT